MTGYFSLVLHTHLPYVRKNGAWPVGEDWLYQVMSETYIPLLGMLAQMENEDIRSCMGITMTPVLCEQLADRYVQDRFVEYLKVMTEHILDDINDFEYLSDAKRKALGEAYYQEYHRRMLAFLAIDGDLLGALASFEQAGLVEIIASSATHAFLPGLADWRSVRTQVLMGIESHRRRFGVNPAGFWIPECAFREGLQDLLACEGVRYVLVDPSALGGLPSTYPYYVGSSRTAAVARSERAHRNAWDERTGYPTDDLYMDSTKYYHGSGLHYWRVTGPQVRIEDKEIYQPAPAQARALDHARHFINAVSEELRAAPLPPGNGTGNGAQPLVLASYDTEVLGHGWKEGIYWLEVTVRSLEGSRDICMTTPSRYLEENPPRTSANLDLTTWGTNKDDSTWINAETGWMWEALQKSQQRLFVLADYRHGSALEKRAVEQAAREVLLLESSDWPYMVAKNRAKEYSIQRFCAHLERFRRIADLLQAGDSDKLESMLGEIEEVDNIFARLDLETIFGEGCTPEEGK
jgi:1,4-alpha-glucan branching enzyme